MSSQGELQLRPRDSSDASEDSLRAVRTSLSRYFNDDTFSDVTIVCGEMTFKAHRLILSAQSKFFSKALTGSWKESSEGKIELQEVDSVVADAMLRFMYSLDYSNVGGASSMVFHTQVYGVADKYDVPSLKDRAMAKFISAIDSGWKLDDFPFAVMEAYDSTPQSDRGLRDPIVEVAVANLRDLVGNKLFENVLGEVSGFAVDMIKSMSSVNETGKKQDHVQVRCPHCSNIMSGIFTANSPIWCMHCGQARMDWTSRVVHD